MTGGRNPAVKSLHPPFLPGQRAGQVDDQGQLGQLRGLEGEGTDLQPPVGPPDLLAQPGNKNQKQANDAPQEEGNGQNLPVAVIHPRRQEQQTDPQSRGHGLFLQEMEGIPHPLRAHREAGAVNHDDPDARQAQGAEKKNGVHPPDKIHVSWLSLPSPDDRQASS